MRKINLLAFFACLLFTSAAFAQNPCGTFEESKWLDHYMSHKHQYVEADSPVLFVPVTMQIIGNDDGGGYFTKKQVFQALCNMNEQFVDAGIQYYLHPTDPFIYINNSSWYEHTFAAADIMINQNYYFDRLNAFIVADPAGNCGYSWQDVIVMGKNCSGPRNTTWAHEVGHHFSLPHTFRGWEGRDWDWNEPAPNNVGQREVERVDGSNCGQAGDRFCDTEPDYISNRWSCNSDGRSFTMLDPSGEEFRADGTLYMSYANDECAGRFSQEQIDAMRANLLSEHISYLTTTTEGAAIEEAVALNSPMDSATINASGEFLTWDAVPNADYYEVQVSLFEHMDFAFPISTIVEGTSLEIDVNLPLNRFLYWRVRPYSRWSFCADDNTSSAIRSFMVTNSVATNELEKKAVAALAPNPVLSGQPMRLEVNASEAFEAQLAIFDVNGRQVRNQAVRIFEGENTVPVETFGMVSGTYRAVLQNEKGSIQKVFAVIR